MVVGRGGLPFCLAGTRFNLKVFLSDLCLISAGPLKRFRQWKLYAQSVLMSFYCYSLLCRVKFIFRSSGVQFVA